MSQSPESSGGDRKPCPMCGEMIAASAVKCRYCGHYLDPSLAPKRGSGSGAADFTEVLPSNMPLSAIASLYLGLASFLIFFGPISVIVSLIALSTLRKNPEMSGRGRAWFGLIAGLLGTAMLVIFIIAVNSGESHPGRYRR